MPKDYPLELLGPDDFQRLCQSLLLIVHPDLQVLPVSQADGGRDAVTRLLVGQRRETAVFQVRFHNKPLSVTDTRTWLAEQLEKELPKITTLVQRTNAKQYYLLTNVPGTSALGKGSIDRTQALLESALPINAHCWWRDDIVRRLDLAPALHWAFPNLLTGSDVLKSVLENGLTEGRARRMAAVRAFLTRELDEDQQVRFREVELESQLFDLFIDVPTTLQPLARNREGRRIEEIVFRGAAQRAQRMLSADRAKDDETLDTDMYEELDEVDGGRSYFLHEPPAAATLGAASALLDPEVQRIIPDVVVEGAPGQGKSTLAQYICQIYRLRLLRGSMGVVTESHRAGPGRLPFKVDLRDFGQWLRRENPFAPGESFKEHWAPSLEGLLAARVEELSGGMRFDVSDLAAVMALSATLVVLDGLDEVPDISLRRQIVEEATNGIGRLRVNSLSLQVVITSRPAAFANSPGFSPKKFRYLELASIGAELITAYAERWLKARRLQPRAAADVRRILRTKLDQPHMRDLARNPMQLAILLSLINTRGASLPEKRTALYDAYVDTFFSREAEKSAVVREYRDLLVDIHRFVAWTLHVEAELQQYDGRITAERLQRVVAAYLEAEGHDPELATKLFEGMVERVVALVSRVEGTYEFEVQPLREYFVARHLYETAPYVPTGEPEQAALPDRFEAVLRDGYWLNVARFMAGCYSKGELASIVEALRQLTTDPELGPTGMPRDLARMFLSDWVFGQAPRLIDDVVAIVADPLGLKLTYLLSPRPRRTEAAALPDRSGRDQLFARVTSQLDSR